MKRVFIIHGWGGNPNEAWFPWLDGELKKHGFIVTVPEMPDTDHPKIDEWLNKLSEAVGQVDKDTYFVGHSIGCQAIMRFLADQKNAAGGVILVAPWLTLYPEDDEEMQKIADLWTQTPIQIDKFKNNAGEIINIFSLDDEVIPVEKNMELFKEKIGGKIIIEKNKGHFNDESGIKKLPILLEEILNISK